MSNKYEPEPKEEKKAKTYVTQDDRIITEEEHEKIIKEREENPNWYREQE